MKLFKKLFRKDSSPRGGQEGAVPLTIEGTHTNITLEPDDAELAAQALLELMARPTHSPYRGGRGAAGAANPSSEESLPSRGVLEGSAYYHALADRIREAHAKAARQATRFIYNCELELQKPRLPLYGDGSVQMLETELYKRIDIIDREGGELKRRWQHCLAEVTVRLMKSTPPEEKPHTDNTDNTEKKDGTQKAQKYAEGDS